MKSMVDPDDAVQIARFVAAFQAACPDQRTVLCQQILATFPPEVAATALWIVRVLGSSNKLAQVVELYALCLGVSTGIAAPDMFYIASNTQLEPVS